MFDDTAARNKNEQIEITSLFMYFNLKGSEKLRNRQNLDAQFWGCELDFFLEQ